MIPVGASFGYVILMAWLLSWSRRCVAWRLRGGSTDWSSSGMKRENSTVDDAMDGTEEIVGKGIESGADAVESGIGKVKGWMNKDD